MSDSSLNENSANFKSTKIEVCLYLSTDKMPWSLLLVLAVSTVMVTSAVIDHTHDSKTGVNDVTYDVTYDVTEVDTSNDVTDNIVIDDVSIDALTSEEIQLLLDDKDR